jgi:cytochrome c peroxidase
MHANRLRHVIRNLSIGAGCIAALSLLTGAHPAASTADTHGAMAMDAQQARLQALTAHAAAGIPPGIDPLAWSTIYLPIEPDNQASPERIALGRQLYFETRLSGDGTLACATCHDASRGFTDHRNVAEGIRGQLGRRNSPTTLNAALLQTQFWDGRAASLEAQAKLPIVNPIEMGQPSPEAAIAGIKDDPQYVAMFQKAYGRAPNYEDLARAIASFERTLLFLDAPLDHYLAGDKQAISASAQRGLELFDGKARCASCHMINPSNPLGTDNRFHNIGVSARHQNFEGLAQQALATLKGTQGQAGTDAVDKLALNSDFSELGRFMVTKNRGDIGAFKTEQLRNVGITAPYMHDGTLQTLWDVVDHYNKGGESNPYLDGGIEPLGLSEDEVNDLVAFLFTLTDRRFVSDNDAAFKAQAALAAKKRPFRDTALATRKVLPFEARVFGKAPALKE